MIARLALVLGTVLGLQCLRALFPLLVYVLRDRLGVASLELGGYAALLFAVAFILPLRIGRVTRSVGIARTVLILAVVRGLFQAWTGDPIVSLGLAAIGVVAFLAMLAAGSRRFRDVVDGILPGALVDASIHALAGTRDLHWGGTSGDLASLVLVIGAVGFALATLRAPEPAARDDNGTALFAWGPYLFLHLEMLGNVARQSAESGWATGGSGALVAGGLGLGWVIARGAAHSRTATFLHTVALVAALAAGAGAPSFLRWPVAQIAAAGLLASSMRRPPPVPIGAGAAFGVGCLLFLAMLFGHYAGYDLPLPVTRTKLFLAGACLLGLTAWLRVPRGDDPSSRATPVKVASAAPVALVLALLPLLRPGPEPVDAALEPPLRVVSFNLHNGFDEQGGFALDRMLDALVEQQPSIVALQEVSRGWVMNGSADLYQLALERTGFTGVAGPSVERDWGNALLANARIDEARTVPLPPRGLRLPRAFTEATLPLADGGSLRVFATHFHQLDDGEAVRVEEARTLVEAAHERDIAMILGDLNAPPDAASVEVLRAAGWRDVAGDPDVAGTLFTYPARAPEQRIDAILVAPSWKVISSEVAPHWGSDHRAVVAEVAPR